VSLHQQFVQRRSDIGMVVYKIRNKETGMYKSHSRTVPIGQKAYAFLNFDSVRHALLKFLHPEEYEVVKFNLVESSTMEAKEVLHV